MRPRLYWIPIVALAGCTALIGDRQHEADLGVGDLAGADLAGVQLDLTQGAGIPNEAQSSLQILPATQVADGSSNVIARVTVKDIFGNAVTNEPITVSVDGSGNILAPLTGLTSGLGLFNATLSSTTAEVKNITASVGGFTLSGQATFTAATAVQGSSMMTISSGPITANGSATATITVTVKDGNGNLVSGQSVSLAANGSANTFTPASGTTTAGVFTATLASTKAQTKTVTATVGSFMLVGMVDFAADVPNGTLSTISASPTTNVVANGSATSTVTVTALDANSNLVGNANVVLTPSGAGASLTATSGMTDASGVFTTTLKSTQSGLKSVTATAGGVAVTGSASVTFTGCPSNGTLTSGNPPVSSSTSAGSHLYTPICAGVDSPEHVYGFTLGSAQSVILDKGAAATAGSVLNLRPELVSPSGCSLDSSNDGCVSSRYLYCPNLPAGTYDAVVDSTTGGGVSYSLALTTAATKANKSYGVITTAPTFTSIAGAGGTLAMAADLAPAAGKYVTATTPFAFTYFGTLYPAGSTITIYQSGYVSFDATVVNTFQNVCLLPGGTASVPPNTILPFWGRIASYQNTVPNLGSIWSQTQGSAPNRVYVIEWADMDGCVSSTLATCNAGTSYEFTQYSFQVLLYETGEIEFRYKPFQEDQGGATNTTANRGFAAGNYATIGLQSTTGVVGVEQQACILNGASGAGPIGTCAPVAGWPDSCTVSKGYLFVPRAASCP